MSAWFARSCALAAALPCASAFTSTPGAVQRGALRSLGGATCAVCDPPSVPRLQPGTLADAQRAQARCFSCSPAARARHAQRCYCQASGSLGSPVPRWHRPCRLAAVVASACDRRVQQAWVSRPRVIRSVPVGRCVASDWWLCGPPRGRPQARLPTPSSLRLIPPWMRMSTRRRPTRDQWN